MAMNMMWVRADFLLLKGLEGSTLLFDSELLSPLSPSISLRQNPQVREQMRAALSRPEVVDQVRFSWDREALYLSISGSHYSTTDPHPFASSCLGIACSSQQLIASNPQMAQMGPHVREMREWTKAVLGRLCVRLTPRHSSPFSFPLSFAPHSS